MKNFDPKTKIERLLLKYPSVGVVFSEAAPSVDGSLTVEEFCFANGVDVVSFFNRLDQAIENAEKRAEADRMQVERQISGDVEALRSKTKPADRDEQPARKMRHDPVVAGLLAVLSVVFAACAAGNYFPDASFIRTVFGIHSSLSLPLISQMLGLLNVAALVGCVMLLFFRKLGIIIVFAGTMLNDILAVALTDSVPFATLLAAILCLCLMLLKPSAVSYRELLK